MVRSTVNVLKSSRMKRGFADTSLGQIHFVSVGDGSPLVLLASAGRSSRMFSELLDELSGNFHLIAIDTPAYGQSQSLPPGTTIEQLADAFAEALDVISIPRTAIYGLHTGNKIATAMAVQQPDRVSKLILAGQSHSLIPDQDKRNASIRDLIGSYVDMSERPATPGDAKKVTADRVAALLQSVDRKSWTHPALGGSIFDHVIDTIEATGTVELYKANFRYDLGRAFVSIRVPTLVLEIATPRETRIHGRQGALVAHLIKGASLIMLDEPDGDALTLENRPGDLAAVITTFLD